jgi:hypothetical protein
MRCYPPCGSAGFRSRSSDRAFHSRLATRIPIVHRPHRPRPEWGTGAHAPHPNFCSHHTRYAICDTRYAIRDMRYAIRDMRYAICDTRLSRAAIAGEPMPRLSRELPATARWSQPSCIRHERILNHIIRLPGSARFLRATRREHGCDRSPPGFCKARKAVHSLDTASGLIMGGASVLGTLPRAIGMCAFPCERTARPHPLARLAGQSGRLCPAPS